MNSMTFQKDGDYIVAYINGKEMGRAKMASIGISEKDIMTMIEANPEEEATDTLNKIKLFNTIYNVGSGGGTTYTAGTGIDITDNTISSTIKESYDHIITLSTSSGIFQSANIHTQISTKSNVPFSKSTFDNTFCQYLYTNGFSSSSISLNASGHITTNNKNYIVLNVYAISNSTLAFDVMDTTNFSITTLTNVWYGAVYFMTDKVI